MQCFELILTFRDEVVVETFDIPQEDADCEVNFTNLDNLYIALFLGQEGVFKQEYSLSTGWKNTCYFTVAFRCCSLLLGKAKWFACF